MATKDVLNEEMLNQLRALEEESKTTHSNEIKLKGSIDCKKAENILKNNAEKITNPCDESEVLKFIIDMHKSND